MTDFDDDDLMTDDALLEAIDALHEEGDEDVEELLSRSSVESVEEVLEMMNENRIISWEEAERILSDANTGPIKCSLPPQTRPSEPDNDTDVEQCIRKLQANDPNLTQINLNNMKVGIRFLQLKNYCLENRRTSNQTNNRSTSR